MNDGKFYSKNSLSFSSIESGCILPYKETQKVGKTNGGVVDNEGRYIDNSGLHEGHGCGYDFAKEDVVRIQKSAIYLGMWFPIWGHCLTDNIKKLWFLQTEQAKALQQEGCDLVYIVMMNNKYTLTQSFIDLLGSLGIKIQDLKEIKEVTQYEKIYIPDDSTFLCNDSINYTQTQT